MQLSFMPDWLTNGTDTVCHYKGNSDPPKNYTEWGELIGALGQHMVSKYGEQTASEFFFEVWKYVAATACTDFSRVSRLMSRHAR
jgi:xylan 1,4-beta-xylosidase